MSRRRDLRRSGVTDAAGLLDAIAAAVDGSNDHDVGSAARQPLCVAEQAAWSDGWGDGVPARASVKAHLIRRDCAGAQINRGVNAIRANSLAAVTAGWPGAPGVARPTRSIVLFAKSAM